MNGQNFFIHKNKRWYPTPFVLNLRSLRCLPRVHVHVYARLRQCAASGSLTKDTRRLLLFDESSGRVVSESLVREPD